MLSADEPSSTKQNNNQLTYCIAGFSRYLNSADFTDIDRFVKFKSSKN